MAAAIKMARLLLPKHLLAEKSLISSIVAKVEEKQYFLGRRQPNSVLTQRS
jgi:hypothetical protein